MLGRAITALILMPLTIVLATFAGA